MNLFEGRRGTMMTCSCGGKSCNGIIQKTDPRKIVDGKVYKLACGVNQEKQNEDSLRQKSGGSDTVQPK